MKKVLKTNYSTSSSPAAAPAVKHEAAGAQQHPSLASLVSSPAKKEPRRAPKAVRKKNMQNSVMAGNSSSEGQMFQQQLVETQAAFNAELPAKEAERDAAHARGVQTEAQVMQVEARAVQAEGEAVQIRAVENKSMLIQGQPQPRSHEHMQVQVEPQAVQAKGQAVQIRAVENKSMAIQGQPQPPVRKPMPKATGVPAHAVGSHQALFGANTRSR
eukprot:CAMPEP_0202889792 /NCGR_PEP_ID=MMETSP1392-20130828/355_1 /ASSEMBLY_ACC=CAM_ASM_000868 /TAXON_ID=225041 /ORGANISM="Chlamydomonas chlamydogama, Strain SAG 11-48b" /LENGTH=214 /DNA_ID=CAMNT_0049573199 /DNA_START=1 /DNA_END=645 /DNA_ORIENTATION=-